MSQLDSASAETVTHEKICRNSAYSVSLNVDGVLVSDGHATLCGPCATDFPGTLTERFQGGSDERCAKCGAATCCESHDSERDAKVAEWAASKNIEWPKPLPPIKLVKESK